MVLIEWGQCQLEERAAKVIWGKGQRCTRQEK